MHTNMLHVVVIVIMILHVVGEAYYGTMKPTVTSLCHGWTQWFESGQGELRGHSLKVTHDPVIDMVFSMV